ncbi:MAG TPA: methionyl-tRNA formyltransferase [bacterium]|nr:methionyl-tRNA formyltransferase [bacterium]HPT30141.1 methionyl-tRNA formyltransferase [bacterium]
MKKRKKIKTIFLGTPEFGASCLEALISSDFFEVSAVISQPDKPVGRKQELVSPIIKTIAQKYHIPVYQPEKIRTETELIKKLDPQLIVVVAYGQIIPQSILDIPEFGCINVHGSLLPRYRGAACLQAAILNGDRQSGVTIMKMDKGLDTGPILAQKKIKLAKDETLESLHDKLAIKGAQALETTLKKYIGGRIKPRAQKEDQASYVKIIQKEDGHINWSEDAKQIERKIRAFNPWPGTFSYLSDEKLKLDQIMFKIKAARLEPVKVNSRQIGELFLYNSALAVQCGQNSLVIIKLQLEGKRAMEVDEFLRGNHSIIGRILN